MDDTSGGAVGLNWASGSLGGWGDTRYEVGARGGNQGHTHTIEPSFVNIYAWYRTA